MKVLRARALGMCFGVRDALEVARSTDAPEEVTIHGELVHNESVLVELRRRGFAMLEESRRDALPGTDRVLVTAHGISERERDRLEAAGKRLIDTTCPLVRRVHEISRGLARRGYFVVVMGKRRHVEVQGIVGDLDRFEVISRPEEARCYGEPRVGVICQTTMPPDTARAILERIRARNVGSEVRWIPTMCRPTLDRQAAVRSLLDRVEALVVVGGGNSNNTRALVTLARDHGLPAFHVQEAADLRPEWFAGFETVGLTAGTSTPDTEIDAVEERLAAMGAAGATPEHAPASPTIVREPLRDLPGSPPRAEAPGSTDRPARGAGEGGAAA